MSGLLTSTTRVEVDGAPLAAGLLGRLTRTTVEDSLAVPDLFVLEFDDGDRTAVDDGRFRIGATVRLSVQNGDDPAPLPLITGEVTALEIVHDQGRGTRTVVRGLDQSHRLHRQRTTASYLNTTYADIVRRVAARAGVQPGRIDATPTVHAHVTQSNQTDWELLKGLAARVGFEVAVVDGRLDFRRPTLAATGPEPGGVRPHDPLQLTLGGQLVRLRATVTAADQSPGVEVRSWDPVRKRAVVARARAATGCASVGTTPADLARAFGATEHREVAVPVRSQAEADALATAIADELAGTHAQLDGVALGSPRLRSGTAVSLGMAGAPLNGRYVLTTTRHTWTPEEGYLTHFTVSGRHDTSLVNLAGARRGGGGSGDGIAGVVVAVVTDVRDPDELGRVKVRFPWLADDFVTDWARVTQFDAGAGRRGAFFLPEVGDEVLVAFEHGAVERPYVVGRLYNGEDRPPGQRPIVDRTSGAVTARGFRSRTGHVLSFEDGTQTQGIALHTDNNTVQIFLNHQSRSLELRAEGPITVHAGTELRLEADTRISLAAPEIAIRGTGTTTLEGHPIRLN